MEHKSTDEIESRPTLDGCVQHYTVAYTDCDIVPLTAHTVCLIYQLESHYHSEVFYYVTIVLQRTSTWALLVSGMESKPAQARVWRHHLILLFLFLYEMALFYVKSKILSYFFYHKPWI